MKAAWAKVVGEKQLDPGGASSRLILGASLSMGASAIFSACVTAILVCRVISMDLRSISLPSSFSHRLRNHRQLQQWPGTPEALMSPSPSYKFPALSRAH